MIARCTSVQLDAAVAGLLSAFVLGGEARRLGLPGANRCICGEALWVRRDRGAEGLLLAVTSRAASAGKREHTGDGFRGSGHTIV